MTLVVNTDTHARVWPTLTRSDAKTTTETVTSEDGDPVDIVVTVDAGTTLALDPGEQADVVLPADFTDPYLKPVKTTKKSDPAPD